MKFKHEQRQNTVPNCKSKADQSPQPLPPLRATDILSRGLQKKVRRPFEANGPDLSRDRYASRRTFLTYLAKSRFSAETNNHLYGNGKVRKNAIHPDELRGHSSAFGLEGADKAKKRPGIRRQEWRPVRQRQQLMGEGFKQS